MGVWFVTFLHKKKKKDGKVWKRLGVQGGSRKQKKKDRIVYIRLGVLGCSLQAKKKRSHSRYKTWRSGVQPSALEKKKRKKKKDETLGEEEKT